MSELPEPKEAARNVSVDELERYLNGLENRFEAKSSFDILKMIYARLKRHNLDARKTLEKMLHFFEATQPENIQQNEIYRELQNLLVMLFTPAAEENPDAGIPPSVGYLPQIYGGKHTGAATERVDLMMPTIRPPEFAGGSIRATVRLPKSGVNERSEAETMRPPEIPAQETPGTEAPGPATDDIDAPVPDVSAPATDDIHSRATLQDIGGEVMAEMRAIMERLKKGEPGAI